MTDWSRQHREHHAENPGRHVRPRGGHRGRPVTTTSGGVVPDCRRDRRARVSPTRRSSTWRPRVSRSSTRPGGRLATVRTALDDAH
ncbi:hypothetical protein QJS66_02960 [Kocuria rhizophila]|nr:hypothetical protein QJS66_02960 [Kocuria rhizophila]